MPRLTQDQWEALSSQEAYKALQAVIRELAQAYGRQWASLLTAGHQDLESKRVEIAATRLVLEDFATMKWENLDALQTSLDEMGGMA